MAAMTAPALARFAISVGCPVIPVRFERLDGCRFRISFYPPLALPATGDRNADVAEIMRAINAQLEEWIRDKPGQWLWLHRRWPES
jgi:KDO2-lipid IV(A) lauroyltransferase